MVSDTSSGEEKPVEFRPSSVHFVGISGRLVAPLAIYLRSRGWRVTGSDLDVFPPVSDWLRKDGIKFFDSYDARNVPGNLDLAIIGTYVKRGNPELEEILDRGLPWDNAASWMGRHVFDSGRNLLVAGTNGKTTTASMTAHILRHSGKRVGWIVGGDCSSLPRSFRLGRHPVRVIEADEYISGLEDLNPKFLHYPSHAVGITHIARDHLDTFPTPDSYHSLFQALVSRIAPGRLLALPGDPEGGCEALEIPAGVRVVRVGFASRCDARITGWRCSRSGSRFRCLGEDFRLPMLGAMNARNAATAAILAREAGVSARESALALADYRAPAARMEPVAERSAIHCFRDDGYHPIALRETIQALRKAFPGRTLSVLFQPRYTGSRKEGFEADWIEVLRLVDRVMIGCSFDLKQHEAGNDFSTRAFLLSLRKAGIDAHSFHRIEEAPAKFAALLEPGDVSLVSVAYRNEAFWSVLEETLTERFA